MTNNNPVSRTRNTLFLLLMMTFSVATLSVTAAQAQDADHVTDVAKVQPPTADELGDFVGSFEGRDFTLEGSTLTYFRQGMQGAIELIPIGPDHFGIVIPPGAQVQAPAGHQIPTFKFLRSESGVITSLVILNPDMSEISRHMKRPEAASQ